MTVPATGTIVRTGTGHEIRIERSINAPIEDVWTSLTDPGHMTRWIGTWTGTPGTGNRITFRMTAEGEDAPEEEVFIHACEPPRHFDVETVMVEDTWRMAVTLSESDGRTSLLFTQQCKEGEDSSSYGIGWEYYVDRMISTMRGEDYTIWDEYYPSQVEHWQEQQRQAYAE